MMKDKKIFRGVFILMGIILLLSFFMACGGKKPEIKDSENLEGQSNEYDELFNVSKNDSKQPQDDEADVLKLLGITPKEEAKPVTIEETKPEETQPPVEESGQQVNQLEKEIDDKDTQLKQLANELDNERQKVYDLQAQLEAERNKPKSFQATGQPPSDYQQRYDDALAEYKSKNYRPAISSFEQLLAANPNNSLADNCQYWIGESYYALGDFTKAIAAFEKVFSFNNSNKSDDAQLKLGICYLRLNENNRAKEEFERLISHYPKSEYISIAKKYIGKL